MHEQEAAKLRAELTALRTRFLRLSEVSRRVESLDLATVLQEVVDGARSLAAAQYGALGVFDDSGNVQDFITSGMTPEERQRLTTLPKGLGILGYLNEAREPLRIADLTTHRRSVGFPENHPAMRTFLGTPILHLGQSVGNIYLTEKEGGQQFTDEDEETLVMFAAHAGMAITNALKFSEEHEARAAVEDDRERLEALVRTSPVGVLVVDARTRTVVSANQEAKRIMGIAPEPGSSLARYQEVTIYRRTDGRKYEIAERPLSRALEHGEIVRAEEILFERSDGRTIPTLINATPIYSESGEITAAAAVIQDMTPLEELQRMRNEFLAMVSHELRAPLTTIKGTAATVLSTSMSFSPLETRRFFRIIDEQVDRLSELVGNLLDVTKIEAGVLVVTPRGTAVADLVDEAIQTFLRAGSRNYVDVDLEPELPEVATDPLRITQVLGNLLSNASKYSPGGSAISVSAVLKEPYLAISVVDQGQGIAADQLPHLFKKFSRVGSSDGQTEGHGLGLAICKGIVEAHGGRIWAESRGRGHGTRFTFTLPIAPIETHGDAEQSTRIAVTGLTRILSVDDDPQALRYIRNVLTEAGYHPIVTGNPNEVIHLFEIEKPHLVLLDVRMPGMDGFQLMEQLGKVSNVPAIFLSGSGGDENVVRALEMGAADYIVKPFSPTELVARIETALRTRPGNVERSERKPYRLGDVTVDYDTRSVAVSGQTVQLTATEYRLLFELTTNAGLVLTHDQLLQRIWGAEYSGEGQLVRVFIGNLRRKIGDDARAPRYIFTVPRVGYRMAKP